MTVEAYGYHRETEVTVAAPVEVVFALLDDPVRLGAHMGRRSVMMAGATMQTETDALGGHAVGSVIRMSGRALGFRLSLQESVVEWVPPQRKVWETLGEPRLLVIGRYRMGFELAPVMNSTGLRIWIDYELPKKGWSHWLGLFFGQAYADWCLQKMAKEAMHKEF